MTEMSFRGFCVGDRVNTFINDSDTPDPLAGVVTAIVMSEFYLARNKQWSYIDRDGPGIYREPSRLAVKLDDGKTIKASAGYLQRITHDTRQTIECKPIKIGELPDTPFWEGDHVHVIAEDDPLIISSIGYHDHYGTYGLESNGRGVIYRKESEITLIARGNYWKWFNDKKEEMVFKNLADEAMFFRSLGMATEVISPMTRTYSRGINEAYDAVVSGVGDAVIMSGGLYGTSPFPVVLKFKDLPDLSERLRAEVMNNRDKYITE